MRETNKSPNGGYDLSHSHDSCPSPNTAALMAPYGTLTPAPVSRTRDGKPRVMDLNNLGLMGGAQQPKQYSPPPQMDHSKTNDGRKNDYAKSPLGSFGSPDSILDLKEEQRMDSVLNRAHQVYMREVHGVVTPTDESLARPLAPVPTLSPLGWEQDKAIRARRATDRIQHEYVNELRWLSKPGVRASTPGELQLDQMRARMQTRQQLEADQQRNKVHQDIFGPSASLNHSSIPTIGTVAPSGPPVTSYATSPRSNAPSWAEETTLRVKQAIMDEARLKEIELDEKRRQLMAKKKGKHTKSKKKKKDKQAVVQDYITLQSAAQQSLLQEQLSQQTGQYFHQQAGQYFSQQPSQQPGPQPGQYISKPAGQQLGPQDATTADMPYMPHRPSAPPAKDSEGEESFNKRRRRLIAKMHGSEGKEVCIVVKDLNSILNPTPPSVTKPTDPATVKHMGASSETARADRYIDNQELYQSHKANNDTSKASGHPALIPRQTSQQAIGWNSDAAKRGLGFKSKLRREATEHDIKTKKTEDKSDYITPEIRHKWKKATFY